MVSFSQVHIFSPDASSFCSNPQANCGCRGLEQYRLLRGFLAIASALPALSSVHSRVWGLTHQWDAGPAGQTASVQERCTCCSSSRSPGPAAPRGGLLPPGASHSHGSSSPEGVETVCDKRSMEIVWTSRALPPLPEGQSRQRLARPKLTARGRRCHRWVPASHSQK